MVVGCVLLIIISISILSRFSAFNVWDDAYMFVRYADHAVQFGSISWNPGGEPTYGLTSLLYLAVVIPARLLAGSSIAFAAMLSSLFSGVLFLILLIHFVFRYSGLSRTQGYLFVFFFFFILAGSGWHWVVHFTSGMDTAFVMAFLTIYFLTAVRYERNPTTGYALLLGILGGLSFAVRPDILIYTITIPGCLLLFSKDKKSQKRIWITVSVMALLMGIQLVFNTLYFKSPLPLPFYAKGLKHYGPFIRDFYRFIPVRELIIFMGTFWPFFVFCGADIFLNIKTWWKDRSAFEKGLFLSTFAFLFYYLFFVLQVMYYHQRFYYPILPALIFLSARSLKNLIDRFSHLFQKAISDSPQFLKVIVLFVLIGFTFTPFLWVVRDLETAIRGGYFARFDVNKHSYQISAKERWFRLDTLSELPDDLVIASTEIGHPAAMNPKKNIIDLSGLNEKDFAHQGFSAEFFFQKHKPDLIYLPHPHYKEMIAEIENNTLFQAEYTYYASDQLDALMGVAILKQSPYYKQMEAILKNDE